MSAPIELKFKMPGAETFAEGFKRAPDLTKAELTGATWQAVLLLEREAKDLTPTGIGAGGGLKGSIAAREPYSLAENIIGEVGSPLPYAVPVEIGSRPHMPPVQPLVDWAEQKLGLDPQEAKSAGFAIARKIAAKGTTGVHMFKRAFEANQQQIGTMFSVARDRIGEFLGGSQ